MKKIFTLLFFVLLLSGTASFAQEKTYKEGDSQINAVLGENFNITLPSNHTTGYSWSLGMVSDNSQVVVTGTDYDTPENPKVGQGGEEVWHLKAVATGMAMLKFYYARSWENEKPVQEVTFNVYIK